jgi:hypothetical protein
MSLESTIFSILANTSTGCGDRVYPDILPQGVTYPAIVYEIDDIEYGLTWDGDNHYDEAIVRVTVASGSRTQVAAAAAAIRTALHGFIGAAYEGETLPNEVMGIIVRGSGTVYALETKIYQQDLQLEIHYKSQS